MPPKVSKVINFYEKMPKDMLDNADNPNFDIHHIKLPFRMCVVAPSGSGKTNFLANLLYVFSSGSKGTFADIIIITKNSDEPIYSFLTKETDGAISVVEGIEKLPNLDKMDKKQNHLVCFDDLQLLKNQDPILNYYIRARKRNCSVIYLAQNYYQVPKVIRCNCSYLAILKLSGARDCRMILSELGLGLEKEQLIKMYSEATSEHMTPFLIAMEEQDLTKKFRKGLYDYLNPADYV